jgi:hypothetical protein
MKRSMLALGLLAVVGCGGTENEGAAPTTSAPAESAPVALEQQAETPRVDRMALLPASAVQHGSFKQTSWGDTKAEEKLGQETFERGAFDPDQLRVVEQIRLQQKFPGGAQ